jgi:hypothetical protein
LVQVVMVDHNVGGVGGACVGGCWSCVGAFKID